MAFGVIIGARLFYVVFYGAGYYLEHPLEIFALNQGGMSFHGGLVGAVVGGSIVCRMYHISIPTVCDLGVIGAPWGLFFGRCANFVNGELWGKETSLPWGVMFPTGGNVYRHPSQLYEAVLEGLVMFCVLYALSRRRPARPQGTFMGTFLVLYGVFRFLIEFVRVPDAQLGYLFGPITMGQCLSLPLVVLGVAVLVFSRRLARPQVGHLELVRPILMGPESQVVLRPFFVWPCRRLPWYVRNCRIDIPQKQGPWREKRRSVHFSPVYQFWKFVHTGVGRAPRLAVRHYLS